MNVKRIDELIKKYTDGTATDAEEQELNNWYREIAHQDAEFPQDETETYHAMRKNINRGTHTTPIFGYFGKWTRAASILVVLSIGISIYVFNHKTKTALITKTNTTSAGKNAAILILANGDKINLNEASNGKLAAQGNIQIAKAKNGQLIYTITGSTVNTGSNPSAKQDVAYNTLQTPVGAQYQVILPDQSKVLLNSMSSLKFPISFENLKERRVILSGEAYFEVTHNEKTPFKVITRGLTTEDLGTEFNIKAYDDDANIKMTLVEGAASVTAGNAYSLLRPGEQAQYRTSINISRVNVDDVIAWKNGYFRFDGDSLEEIMKNISRSYNIQYVFRDEALKRETYGFVAPKSGDISALLKLMEQTGTASFTKRGSTVTISKK